MLKPDAVNASNTGAIIKLIEEAGFRIVAIKKTLLSPDRAGEFYAVHKDRPFYKDLCKYMSSGAIVPMILEKENAVEVNGEQPAPLLGGHILQALHQDSVLQWSDLLHGASLLSGADAGGSAPRQPVAATGW